MAKTRLLRSYERRAQKDHRCQNCEIPIFPGDWYCGFVYVAGRRLWVEKIHGGCPVLPDDEVRRVNEIQEHVALPLAA